MNIIPQNFLHRLLLFSCAFAILSGSVLKAQSGDKQIANNGFRGKMVLHPRFTIGLGGYGGVSTVTFNPQVTTKSFVSLGTGVVARVQTESFAALQVELNYSMRGWKESYTDQLVHSYSRSIHFVEMPLLAHLFVAFGRMRLFLNAGPQIGYCINEASSVQGDSFTPAQIIRHSMPIQNRLAWGLAGGPGLSFYLGSKAGWLELEGRFYYGLNDLFRNGPAEPYGRSAEIQGFAKFSYLLPIGKY